MSLLSSYKNTWSILGYTCEMSSFCNTFFKLKNVDVITVDRYIFVLNVPHPLYTIMKLTTIATERTSDLWALKRKTISLL